MHGTSDLHVAHEANLVGGLIDPNDYRQNVMAVEAATGCTADPLTIFTAAFRYERCSSANSETEPFSLSWILRGKPSHLDSSPHNLEGPKPQKRSCALTSTPTKN